MTNKSDKQYLEDWNAFRENISRATPIDLNESEVEKLKRIKRLEGNDEEWFKYYFPNFYTSEPAPWHKTSTKYVMPNPEFFIVRAWARELSKSGRTMMEVLKLALMSKKKNILMVSNSFDNAKRLLLPYKSILEKNNRIINDYGKQESIGSWEAGEFVTRKGVAFRAVGSGQTPRGSRKDEIRPDVLLVDDIDTDEECRNKDSIKKKVEWLQDAVFGTRSISNPMLVIVCGNIIAKYSTVTELMKYADRVEVINIRDKDGKSTWPQKNTEAMIDRVLSKISWRSGQKEYFNNPITQGDVFKEITYGKCPPIHTCDQVVMYADPSTSNKDRGTASHKAVCIVGYKNLTFYVYWVRVDVCGNSKFVDWLFDAYRFMVVGRVDIKRMFIENNSLQDPHYEQVIQPLILQMSKDYGFWIPLSPDTRKKSDKFERIEGTLEPINRHGKLIFNEKLKSEPNMQRAEDQILGVSKSSKTMDFPDCLEGAVWLIQNNVVHVEAEYAVGHTTNHKY